MCGLQRSTLSAANLGSQTRAVTGVVIATTVTLTLQRCCGSSRPTQPLTCTRLLTRALSKSLRKVGGLQSQQECTQHCSRATRLESTLLEAVVAAVAAVAVISVTMVMVVLVVVVAACLRT